MSGPTAVLLMAYGTAPSSGDADVRAYLDHILQFYRRTSPTDEEVAHLRERYEKVGGSPLYAITERVTALLSRALEERAPGAFRAYHAMKHSPPFIEDQVRRIAADGATEAVAVALAPFRSRLSTDGYFALVRETNTTLASRLAWRFVEDWHLHPMFLDLWEARIRDALDGEERMVIFTNHSLPVRVRQWQDPYERVFAETAQKLADRLQLRWWTTAYQSAGGGNQPWLGPGVEETLERERDAGQSRFLLAPVGFLMDHLEVLYDIDVVLRARAAALGVALTRTEMPNDDERLIGMLVDVVEAARRLSQ